MDKTIVVVYLFISSMTLLLLDSTKNPNSIISMVGTLVTMILSLAFYCILASSWNFHQKSNFVGLHYYVKTFRGHNQFLKEVFHIEAEEIIYDPKCWQSLQGKVHINHIPNQQGWQHLYAHEIIYQQKLCF